MVAAGGAPQHAKAGRAAKNAAPRCTPPVGTARNSPTRASTSSAKKRLQGVQSPASVDRTAAATTAASSTSWPAIRIDSRRRVLCSDGTSAIAFTPNSASVMPARRLNNAARGLDPRMAAMRLADDVAAALADGRPVVALESTLIAHGLPRGRNLEVARELEAAVRAEGAVPATIAVVDGVARIGLDAAALEALALGGGFVKAGVRDLAPVLAARGSAATTVASTSHLAALSGIRLFATGGLGGVHREARESWDESADLTTLAATGLTIVCAGVKSILDVQATLERLETLNVCVLGYRTERFPGFYLADSGFPVPWRVDTPEEVASVMRIQVALGLADRAIVVANPLPEAEQVDPELHDRVLAEALAAAAEKGIRGGATTPFLLDRFHRETGGVTLEANVALVRRNAVLAARIAAAAAA